MFNFKNKIDNNEAKQIDKILKDLDKFEFIIFTYLTHDKIYENFENECDIVQDIILEDFSDHKQISEFQDEKMKYINEIRKAILYIKSNNNITNEKLDLLYNHIKNCYNIVYYYFSSFNDLELEGFENWKYKQIKVL
jgi:hypothetical protein